MSLAPIKPDANRLLAFQDIPNGVQNLLEVPVSREISAEPLPDLIIPHQDWA